MNIRWKIANALNRLPKTCWVNLVEWAQSERRIWDLRGVNQEWLCDKDFESNSSCYCGKRKKETK